MIYTFLVLFFYSSYYLLFSLFIFFENFCLNIFHWFVIYTFYLTIFFKIKKRLGSNLKSKISREHMYDIAKDIEEKNTDDNISDKSPSEREKFKILI